MAIDTPLIVIVGETSSGKSGLALKLAEKLNGEIICTDSTTVCRGFEIGSAKPDASDRKKVRHNLLDVVDPRDDFNVAIFQAMASAAISDISQRAKLPFLVGGSGLYIDSVLYGFEFLPPSLVDRRDELNKMSLTKLLKEVHHLGLNTDKVDVNNKRRVIRLIENNGVRAQRQSLRPDTLIIGLRTPRDDLRASIEQRVDRMLTLGLENEVGQLVDRYGWRIRPMQSIGYHEWQDYFKGTKTLAETRLAIIKDSLMLAKKQRTWFKKNKSIHWFSSEDKFDIYVDLITTFLNK